MLSALKPMRYVRSMSMRSSPRQAQGRRTLRAVRKVLAPRSLAARVVQAREFALDVRMIESSPIPMLPSTVSDAIYSSEIVLPPRGWLGAGTQTVDGLVFIASLAMALQSRTVFEIGTHRGITAWCLARNLPKATVHTLDLPPAVAPALALEDTDLLNLDVPERVFAHSQVHGRIVQHLGDSATFDFAPWHGSCDLVYVDGAHSEAYVASDTANALELVAPGGAVVWDDYWRGTAGVPAVLDARTDIERHRVPETRLVVHLAAGAHERLGAAARAHASPG